MADPRAYGTTNIKDVKVGDQFYPDDGFDCVSSDQLVTVKSDDNEGGLYFECSEGKHFLEGQEDFDGKGYLVGLSKA